MPRGSGCQLIAYHVVTAIKVCSGPVAIAYRYQTLYNMTAQLSPFDLNRLVSNAALNARQHNPISVIL